MNPYNFKKRSTEKRRLFFDVTKSLVVGDSLLSINSVSVIDINGTDVTASIISGTPTILGNEVIAIVQNGVNYAHYTIRVRVNTVGGDIIQDNLLLIIDD